jgi:hypothetical protein
MPSSIDNADIVTFDYRPDAIKIARHVAEHGKLPGSFTSYHIDNSFRFACGRVPASVRALFSLGPMASFGDLGRAIERRLASPKPEPEPEYIGDRPLTEKELRREVALRKAGVDMNDGGKFSVPPATPKTESDASPAATDWRAAIKGE